MVGKGRSGGSSRRCDTERSSLTMACSAPSSLNNSVKLSFKPRHSISSSTLPLERIA